MEITGITPQKHSKHRVSVYVDHTYAFSLDEVDLVRLGLKTGRQMTEQDIAACNVESNFSKAKAKALDALSHRAMSTKELRDKLLEKGFDDSIADMTVDDLTDLGYLDDTAFAALYAEQAMDGKGWGKRKVKYELLQKGVDGAVINEVLEAFDAPPYERMAELLQMKYGSLDVSDRKQKERATRFLASRGYDFSDIGEALARWAERQEEA